MIVCVLFKIKWFFDMFIYEVKLVIGVFELMELVKDGKFLVVLGKFM